MTEKINPPIGILGGTFDPIHLGHIKLAQIVLEKINLSEIRFIPNYQPPHRTIPIASPKQRLTMLHTAIKDYSKFVVDDREIKRKGISYTIDTLKSLRTEFPNTSLCWIIGFDEFAKLNTWHQWRELNNYANFIIVNRPNVDKTLPQVIEQFLCEHEIKDQNELSKYSNGKIYQLQIPPFEISATEIRKQLAQNKKLKGTLPERVYEYIKEENLYKGKGVSTGIKT